MRFRRVGSTVLTVDRPVGPEEEEEGTDPEVQEIDDRVSEGRFTSGCRRSVNAANWPDAW